MRNNNLTKLCVYSLGLVLACTLSVNAREIENPILGQERISAVAQQQEQILRELSQADIVYLGETHDREADHQVQLEIIRELHRQNPKIAIGMEMFQRPYQEVLDRYLRGELSEEQLVEQTEYENRWGFPWEYYAPILRFAKENQLPVLALNTPSEVTRKVARSGWEHLTEEEREQIPPIAEIKTDNDAYRQMVQEAFAGHQQAGHGSSMNLDNFFLAQVLWDETMAETIAEFAIANPDYQVVVLAGQGHIVYGYGIPSRVARRLDRLSDRNFIQRSLLFNISDEMRRLSDIPIADYFWQHEE